jgi:hypothetical protein
MSLTNLATAAPESLPSKWQSDDSVMACGRLLMLSSRLRLASKLLRQTIGAFSCEVPPLSRESLEVSDTTHVVSF